MGWFERWKAENSVEGETLIRDLSDGAKADLLRRLREDVADGGRADEAFEIGFRSASQGDPEEAIHWYTISAEAGHGEAMASLAILLEESGRYAEAIRWYKAAAKTGVRNAMYNLALLHKARGDAEKSVRWFKKAGRAGDADAMVRVAISYLKSGELHPAIEWYSDAVDAGISDPRISTTLRLLIEAAEGDAEAMEELGRVYDGFGLAELSIVWLRKSADKGNLNAIHNLGIAYEKLGNNTDALDIYSDATRRGHTESLLGVMRILNGVDQFKTWLIEEAVDENPVAREFLRKFREEGERESSSG